MTTLEFSCALALFALSGIGLMISLCVIAKRADRKLQEYVNPPVEPEIQRSLLVEIDGWAWVEPAARREHAEAN